MPETVFTSKRSAAAITRFIYYPDHLVRIPMPQLGIVNFVQTLFSEPAFQGLLWKLPLEGTVRSRDSSVDDESVGDFLARRLGSKLVDRIVSAVFHGIYAGDVYQLSAKSLLPKQFRDELEQGSILEGVMTRVFEGPEMSSRDNA